MQADSRAAGAESTISATPADLALPTFARGVIALLQIWPALRLAVTHNWKPAQTTNDPEYPPQDAGQKRARLAEELVDAYYSSYPSSSGASSSSSSFPSPDKEDIQDFLLEFFEFEYGVLLEDSSEVQLAQDLEDLWKECILKARSPQTQSQTANNSQSLLDKFERMADKAKTEDADPAKAFRGTRTGPQDDEEEDEYTSEDDDDNESGNGDADMDVDDSQSTSQQTTSAHPLPRHREEPEVDEDGFTTVTKKKGGRP